MAAGSQAAAYLTVDDQDYTKQYLWISEGEANQPQALTTPTLTTSWIPPLAVTPDGHGVILFDANWQLTQVGGNNLQGLKLAPDTQAYVPPGYNHGDLYQAAQAPDRSKAIYYNKDWLLLADFSEGRVTPIDLASLRTEQMPPIARFYGLAWSPDGNKIAFIAQERDTIPSLDNLFVLDFQSGTLSLIRKPPAHHINDLEWLSDSLMLLFPVVEVREDGYGKAGLFLVDNASSESHRIAALPDAAVIASNKSLLWSSQGSRLAVVLANKPNNPGLYVIEVEFP